MFRARMNGRGRSGRQSPGSSGPPPLPSGTFLSAEDASFVLPTPQVVRYGSPTQFVDMLKPAGTTMCNTATFGGVDPHPFTAKTCTIP